MIIQTQTDGLRKAQAGGGEGPGGGGPGGAEQNKRTSGWLECNKQGNLG